MPTITDTDITVSGGANYVNAFNDRASQTLNGTGATPDSTIYIYVYLNGSTTPYETLSTTANDSGVWSYRIGALPSGNVSIVTTAEDSGGNDTSAGTLNITVDKIAPAAPTITDSAVVNGYVDAANDTSAQTLSGTAETGSTVNIYGTDGSLVASVVATNGTWSYQIGHLVSGDYSYAVTATDPAGNISSSNQLSFTVAATGPSTPMIGDSEVINNYVNAAHDSPHQTLSGTADAGDTVDIYLNGSATPSYTTTADGSGNWSVTVGALANGSYSYIATATDNAGDSASSAALKFTVDTSAPSAPTIGDSAISNGYVTLGNQTLTGTAQAGSTVNISGENGTLNTTVTANSSGVWTYQADGLSDGAQSFSVTATDPAGNVSPSNALSFTVDTSTPAAPTITDNAVATSGVVNYVNAAHDNASQTLSGTAVAGNTVNVYLNGSTTPSYTVIANGSGAWSVPVGALATGAYDYTVTQTNAAGSVSSAGELKLTVDTTAPGAPTIKDTNISNGYVTSGNQTLSGTAEVGSTVNIYGTGGTLVASVVATDGTWTKTLNNLPNGANSFSVTATDAAGNVSTSNVLDFTVDASTPAAPSIADNAAPGGYVNAAHDTSAQTLSGTAVAGNTVNVYLNGSATPSFTVIADGSGNWSAPVGALSDGTYNYTATQTNAAGTVSPASVDLQVKVDTVAPSAPTITDSADSNGYVNAAGDVASQTLSGTAAEDSTVNVYGQGGVLVGTTTANSGGYWSVNVGSLSNGLHSYSVTATDAAGNVSPSSALSFTVDTSLPGESLPSAPTDPLSGGGSIPINNVSVSDAGGGTLTTVVSVADGSLTASGSGVSGTGTNTLTLTGTADQINGYLQTLSYKTTLTSPGSDTLTVKTTDQAGNTTSGGVSIDVTCFYPGTLIRTPSGEVAVETLKAGDLVLTHEGRAVPVRWLGRQTVSTIFANKMRILPIRIKTGALGDNLPERDLLVSPDHAILVGGILIHAGALVNDSSIVRETAAPTVFTYYHVETDNHSLILAEGAPAETFVDNVERLRFDNWAEYEALYPEGKAIDELPYPRAKAHRQVPVYIRIQLAERALAIGAVETVAAVA